MQNQNFKESSSFYQKPLHYDHYQLSNVAKKPPKLRNKFVLQSSQTNLKSAEDSGTQTSETIIQFSTFDESVSKDSLSTVSASPRPKQEEFFVKNRSLTEQYLRKSKRLPLFLDQAVRPSNSHESRFAQSQSIETHFNHPNFIQDHDDSDDASCEQCQEACLHMNFMSPTVSSEQKNHSRDFQLANKLLPRIHRGRSLSPQLCKSDRNTRIPYIDQSATDVSSIVTLVNVKREPNRLQNYKDAEYQDQNLVDLHCEASIINGAVSSDRTSTSTDSITPPLIQKLKSKDWNTSLKALAEIIEICRINGPAFVSPFMASVYQKIIELLKSPRTYVCRTACQACGHLFEYVKDTRKPEFDEIVDILLFKTADANRFLRYDANLALDCMVTHIPIMNAVRCLCNKGPLHKNPLVRTATARLLICSILITGPTALLNSNTNESIKQRIFVTLGRFLDDKNLETRKYAERLYKILCRETSFNFYLKRYLNTEQINKIKTTLKLVRKTPK